MAPTPTPTQDDGAIPVHRLLATRLLPNSEKALLAALQLADIDGVGGWIVGKIPEKPGAPFEFHCTVGRAELILRSA